MIPARGTSKTEPIDQILGVLEITAKYYQSGLPIPKAYQKSVKEIAHKYSIRYQTIADGCRRRLGLDNVNQFIELLGGWLEVGSQKLKDLLIKNASELNEYKINNFFKKQLPIAPSLSGAERNVVIKDYVDGHYVEYLKQVISTLSQSDKEKVLAELAKMSNSKL